MYTMNKTVLLFLPLLVISGCLFLYNSNIVPTLYWTITNEEHLEYVSDNKSGKGKIMHFTKSN